MTDVLGSEYGVVEPEVGTKPAEVVFEPSPPRWLRPLRDRVRRLPGGVLIWKIGIALIGGLVVLGGVVLIPLPGPGWGIVFLGLAVWATEFHWAQRLLQHARRFVRRWTDWAREQPLIVRLFLGIAGLALLAGLAYLGWRFLL
jgi:uncharacterized protein (TIGR02611 family)